MKFLFYPVILLFFTCTLQAAEAGSDIIEIKNWQVYCSADKPDINAEYKFKDIDSVNNLMSCLDRHSEGYALLSHTSDLAAYDKTGGFLPGRMMWADAVTVNGVVIGSTGGMPPEAQNYFNIPRFYRVVPSLVEGKNDEIRILLYMNTEGGLLDVPLYGPYESLAVKASYREFFGNTVNLIVFFLLLAVTSYHLLLYYKRPSDRENLYFSLMLMAYAGYTMNMFIWWLPEPFFTDYLLWNKLVMFFLFAFLYLMGVFFTSVFTYRLPEMIEYALMVLAAVPALVLMFTPDYYHFFEFRKYALLVIPAFLLLYGFQIYKAVRSGSRLAKIIAIGILPAIGVGIVDLFQSVMQWKTDIYLGPLGIPIFLGSIAFSLGEKFVRVHNRVEDLNRNLEQKVRERTEKLQNSLNEIRALKEQQDADYFLTSLLLKPLGRNMSRSNGIEITDFARQKKTFMFRSKQHEIGGDLNSVHELELNGKVFSVFINSDAMGKSMQGAGGALALGVVFKAKVTRTQLIEKEKKKSPELWIKECHIELQKAFEEFDGSMLVSCVIGLIDHKTGVVYLCNAEHPRVVLYRDGKASLLSDESTGAKLGSPLEFSAFKIDLIQLYKGDLIISGSDGRDDLMTGYVDGRRVINHDENLFLTCVEEGQGEIKKIVKAVENKGEITDDFSLVSVQYKNPEPVVLPDDKYKALKNLEAGERLEKTRKLREQYPDDARLFAAEAVYHLRLKNYTDCLEMSREVYRLNPADNRNIRRMAGCEKKLRNYNRAIDYAEILRLREPENIEIINFLAEIYTRMRRFETAGKLLKRATEIDPGDKRLIKLTEKLKEFEAE